MEAKPGDICVLNGDDPMVMSIPVPDGVKKVLFGRRMCCDVELVLAKSIDGGSSVRLILKHQSRRVEFMIHGPGLHLALNACALVLLLFHWEHLFLKLANPYQNFNLLI